LHSAGEIEFTSIDVSLRIATGLALAFAFAGLDAAGRRRQFFVGGRRIAFAVSRAAETILRIFLVVVLHQGCTAICRHDLLLWRLRCWDSSDRRPVVRVRRRSGYAPWTRQPTVRRRPFR
jgi:hypothetical protein